MLITIIFKNNVAIEESSSPHNLAKQGEISAKFCFELAKQLCFELRLVNPTQLHNTYYILFVLCFALFRFIKIFKYYFQFFSFDLTCSFFASSDTEFRRTPYL